MCFLPNELATENSLRLETMMVLPLRLTSNPCLTAAPTSTSQLGDPLLKPRINHNRSGFYTYLNWCIITYNS